MTIQEWKKYHLVIWISCSPFWIDQSRPIVYSQKSTGPNSEAASEQCIDCTSELTERGYKETENMEPAQRELEPLNWILFACLSFLVWLPHYLHQWIHTIWTVCCKLTRKRKTHNYNISICVMRLFLLSISVLFLLFIWVLKVVKF